MCRLEQDAMIGAALHCSMRSLSVSIKCVVSLILEITDSESKVPNRVSPENWHV